MISAFVNRRPWAAALIALFLSPMLGMFYLGRGRLGLSYLLLILGAYGFTLVAAHFGFLPLSLDAATGLLAIAVNIVGAVHCERLAARSQPSLPRQWFARWYALLAIWGLPVALAVVVRAFLWEPFNILAASMEPTLIVGDHLFVSKLAYNGKEPQRGDLVVFLLPEDNRTAYAKRLLGLPGDRLQWQGGTWYLNGTQNAREEVRLPHGDHRGTLYRETLTAGRSYFIRELGDDLRMDDTETYEVPEGHYFFVGDNRDNSLDSRSFIGFVPRGNFIGKIVLIYWNSEAQKLRYIVPD